MPPSSRTALAQRAPVWEDEKSLDRLSRYISTKISKSPFAENDVLGWLVFPAMLGTSRFHQECQVGRVLSTFRGCSPTHLSKSQ